MALLLLIIIIGFMLGFALYCSNENVDNFIEKTEEIVRIQGSSVITKSEFDKKFKKVEFHFLNKGDIFYIPEWNWYTEYKEYVKVCPSTDNRYTANAKNTYNGAKKIIDYHDYVYIIDKGV